MEILLAAMLPAAALAWDAIDIDLPPGGAEKIWRDALAKLWKGKTEVKVEAGRVDVVTEDYAVELDWPNKWHEGFGQALHYADETGKTGVLALISYGRHESIQEETRKKFDAIEKTCKKHGVKLVILFPAGSEDAKSAAPARK